MATASQPSRRPAEIPELHSGDRMTREEFHRIYEMMPEDFHAELIGGIVYVSSPLKLPHGTNHLPLGTLFFAYEAHTPGVQSGDNATVLLGKKGEPQPDLFLRILPEYGGQSRTAKEYVVGAPELLGEIANSSRSIDLHGKLKDYRYYGVREYLVICIRETQIRWFNLTADVELNVSEDGIIRIQSFPGLWIDEKGLLARDFGKIMDVLNLGLASAEHAAFVNELASRKSK